MVTEHRREKQREYYRRWRERNPTYQQAYHRQYRIRLNQQRLLDLKRGELDAALETMADRLRQLREQLVTFSHLVGFVLLSGCVTYHYVDTCTRSQLLVKPPWSTVQIPPMPSGHCERQEQ